MDSSNPGARSNESNPNKRHAALLVFSAAVVQQLSTKDVRLEPTYVGVRRVRPSSRVVQKALQQQQQFQAGSDEHNEEETNNGSDTQLVPASTVTTPPAYPDVVFKVREKDGTERRMTKKEKKVMKQQLMQQRKFAKQEQKRQQEQQLPKGNDSADNKKVTKRGTKRNRTEETATTHDHNNGGDDDNGNSTANDDKIHRGTTSSSAAAAQAAFENDTLNDNLHYLSKVGIPAPRSSKPAESLSIIEQQELADLRGEREGVPPVMLSPSLARVLLLSNPTNGSLLLPCTNNNNALSSTCSSTAMNTTGSTVVQMDDDLAQQWAKALTDSMEPALDVRGREDMRSMKYAILPEVWNRLRPDTLLRPYESSSVTTSNTNNLVDDRANSQDVLALQVPIRPSSTSPFDCDLEQVVKVLHENTSLYLSCGAKFGCDLLLYDGPRSERHAFAGLRLVVASSTQGKRNNTSSSSSFCVPSAYSLAGYVRCLNTAGKLALLATVRRESKNDGPTNCCVAFVDLKLERIDGTKRSDVETLMQKLDRSNS